ncbi:GPI inositol deacylase [Sporothrix curviconia]|uniref:GPI inositol-deacylase n=1 Tax=Sporothrix curviconia TaxID=1260050 RepID=A0ABP0BSB0_9PEZI
MQKPFSGFSAGDNPAPTTFNGAAPASPSSPDAVPGADRTTAPYPSSNASPAAPGASARHDSTPNSIPRHPLPSLDPLSRAFRQPVSAASSSASAPAAAPVPASSASTPRTSPDPRHSAARSRRSGASASSSLSSSSSNSTPTSTTSTSSTSSTSAHRDAQARNGLARLAPIIPFTPPATVLSASASRRSPTLSSHAPPSFSLSPPAISTSAAPSPLFALPGNTVERNIAINIDDDDDGSHVGGSSGIAYRVNSTGTGTGNGNGSIGLLGASAAAPASKYALGSAAPPIMEKTRRSERPEVLRQRARSPWAITLLTLSASLLGAVLLGLILKSLVTRQFEMDPKGCRMSYMRPSYAHLSEFDTEHTRFASKYSLYLYREQGVDDETKLKGIPVLFVPGNAGSYKQVRPIASEAANYFHDIVQHNEGAVRSGARSLDFFTVDFNEDITAFHGQTLLDQAEYLNEAIRYILSLYLDPRMSIRDSDIPDPTSVIILGHSMGGVVARTMLIMPNYQSNSINTIVTLSAPHARPPVTFDGEIVKIYDDINDYWRRAYSQQWANNNPLWHVTLVSIAGGGLDTVVPSDYANLESLVPDTHGFTVFTTTIPNVWTSMDHQAILWCDQFRKVISRALYDIVDVHRATQTKPRAERMRVFKKHFLTGMESIAERDVPSKEPTTLLTLEDKSNAIIAQGERLVLRSLGDTPRLKAHLLPIPPPSSSVGKRFTLLTDQQLDKPGDAGKLEVLFCSVFPLQSGQAGVFPIKMDLSGESTATTRLACKNAASDVIVLPASRRSSRYPFTLGEEREAAPFSYLQYDIDDISEHQFVAVIDKATVHSPGFVMAEFSDNSQSLHTRDVGLRSLLVFGLKFRLPAKRPMVTEIKIPSALSSLLAYRLEIGNQICGEEAELFTPLVRQYLSEPFESKYYVNARQASVSLHGVAPYMPPPLARRPTTEEGGLSFQFWTDPTCNSSIQVRLTVDIMGSMGKLYMRYRTVFAAFPVLIVALVLQKQFRVYDETGIFITFTESLDLCLRKSIPVVVAALTVFSLSVGGPQAEQTPATFWNWRNATEVAIDFHKNDLLAGTQDPFYWFLIPLISVICIGVCTAINYAALALTHILGFILSIAMLRPAFVPHRNTRRTMPQTALAADQILQQQQQQQQQSMQTNSQQFFSPAFIQSTPRRRLITTAVLLFLVSTAVPYQFAYLVACLVQIATTVRALRVASDTSSKVNYNFYNYVHSILILMLWILPINLPILAVWIRNLAVHWLTPFSSHHNVLSIMPFIVLVETLTTGRMVPRVTTRLKYVVSFLLFGLAVAAAVYGVSYAYMIHHLVNVVVAWLVIVHTTGDSEIWSGAVLTDLFENGTADRKQGKSP